MRVALAGVVQELRVLLLERERDFADRAVAVLGDDQVGLAGALGVLVVVLVAVDEHHQVGVLLEVPRLAQVRELRFLVRARLDRAAELRERDHRHAELAREDLQAAAQLADGGHARVVAAVGAHQLQVVDDDQAQPALALRVQPPRLRADLEHPHVAGVVHPQRRRRQALGGLEDLRPALLGHAPLAQLLALDPRLRGDEPLGQLGLGHLQAEQRHGLAVLDGGVLGDVADERALAHRGAGGDDDQVARLKAAGDLVEVLEPGRRPGQRGALDREAVQLVELLVEHLFDRAEVLLAVVAGDLEHRLLGLLDELARRGAMAEHALLDLIRGPQQPPQQRVLAHDLRVAAGVSGGRHDPGQPVDRRDPADVLELAALAQAVGDREHVDRLGLVVQREHRLVDRAVALAVEVLRAQPLFDHQRVQRAV